MVGLLLEDRNDNKMRRTFKIITFVIIIFVLISLNVPAHPGRTDANGGHWNHSTGEYHYHTGEYAGKNKSSSSSSTTKNMSTIIDSAYDKLFEEDDEESVSSVQEDLSNKKQKNYTWLIIIGGIVLLFVGFGIINAIRERLSNKKKEELQPTELDMSMIPDGIGIDDNMLPYVINRKYGYGKRFNAFVTPNSRCYHTSKCSYINSEYTKTKRPSDLSIKTDPDIRHSRKREGQIMKDFRRMRAGEISPEEFEMRYDALVEQHGVISKGENPAREIEVPRKTADGKNEKINGKSVIHRYVAMTKYAPCSHCKPRCFVDDWYITFMKKNNIEDKYEILNFTNNNNR